MPLQRKGADGVRRQSAGGFAQPAPCQGQAQPVHSWGCGQTLASLQRGAGKGDSPAGSHWEGSISWDENTDSAAQVMRLNMEF